MALMMDQSKCIQVLKENTFIKKIIKKIKMQRTSKYHSIYICAKQQENILWEDYYYHHYYSFFSEEKVLDSGTVKLPLFGNGKE